MATVRVRRVGKSLGIALPKGVLERFDLVEGDELHLTETDGSLCLSPRDAEFELQLEIARKGIAKYANALRLLAE